MKLNRKLVTILAVLILVVTNTITVSAASIKVSNTTKTALDKIIASANKADGDKIQTSYNDLLLLQKDIEQWDELSKKLHDNNEEDSSVISKQIKQIDADKLTKLGTQVNQTKEKYKPLFAIYTKLNQQLADARKLKNKNLTSILQTQAEVMKITVQLARLDISNKEKTLKTAKEQTTNTIQKIRATLAGADPIKAQIKNKKSLISTLNKQLSTEWSSFIQIVKKGTPRTTSESLTSLVSLSRKINEHKQATHQYEKQINGIILKAKSQIP